MRGLARQAKAPEELAEMEAIWGAIDINLFDGVPAVTLTDVRFLPFGRHPPRFIVLPDRVWDGTGPMPTFGGTVRP